MEQKVYKRSCRNKYCKTKFIPKGDNQMVCGVTCVFAYQIQVDKRRTEKEGKDRRKRIKVMKEEIKTLSDHKKELQVLVNKYVQLRDKGRDCVSCGVPDTGLKRDASHFWSQGGTPSVRFDLDNIHSSCVHCNRDLHGNLLEYRPRLIKRIGRVRFEMLEYYRTRTIKFTIPEIIELKDIYRKKIREFKK